MYEHERESSGYYGEQSHDDEDYNQGQRYGHNYRNYRMTNEPTIKGKIEQKYWKTKQKALEKLNKDQDEFVIAGDAEVDARLEAFQHIKLTCMQLMAAIECYQNKIFALSQDENEMGRFLRDQGSLDKTKAGKMMIAVGKSQSFAAQQRLGLRSSLARLYAEIETFRFRAIQDTQITVTKMEQARTDYRSRLLWMADISKELDPDQYKRLDKFRDVQFQVKAAKKLFDRLKGDVCQKIDLLSASRCNLLSATLEPYQSSMVKFLSTTAKSYNTVYEQYKGHPSYQFNILKNIIPNNGIVDDDDEEIEDGKQADDKPTKKKNRKPKSVERAEEVVEDKKDESPKSEDDKLISFDSSPSEETAEGGVPAQVEKEADLLGVLGSPKEKSPGFGDYTEAKETGDGFEDLLGKFEENNLLADRPPPSNEDKTDPFSFISGLDSVRRDESSTQKPGTDGSGPSIDDLLFGSPNKQLDGSQKTDFDILSDVLTNQSLGITEAEQNNSFSDQWQSMFGAEEDSILTSLNEPKEEPNEANNMVDANIKSDRMYMPSFLLEQMRKKDPESFKNGPPKSALSVNDSKSPPTARKGKESKGKDMSAWFNLFADLDPLANPDDVGGPDAIQGGDKQAC